ncbi:MAG: hypothetical protein ABI780_04740 [Ardenticatenales bacterium]
MMRPFLHAVARRSGRMTALLIAALLLPALGGARPEVTLEDTLNLSSSPGLLSAKPSIAIATDPATNTGTVHVVWEEDDAEYLQLTGVAHRYRPFNLATGAWLGDWSAMDWVYESAREPAIAARGNTVVVALVMPSPSVADAQTSIALVRWDPVAGHWSSVPDSTLPQPLQWGNETNYTANCKQPDVSIDALGDVWMTWIDTNYDSKPFYARVSIEPSSFGQLSALNEIFAYSDRSQSPRIATGPDAGDPVYAAWSRAVPELGQDSVFRSLQIGGHWDTSEINVGAHGRAPDIAVGPGGSVCTAWQEQVDGGAGQPDIYLDCNVPGHRGINLSGTANDRSVEPSVIFGAPEVGPMVAWREQQQSPDGSINFKPAEQAVAPIAIEGGPVSSPVIATIGGIVHAVWVKDDGTGGEDVFYGRFPSALTTPTSTPTATTRRTATPTRTPIRPTPTNTRRIPSGTPHDEATPTPPNTPISTIDIVRGRVYLPCTIVPRPQPQP